ncbi:MAG: site-specific DNA-methyltransferase [Candidatus Stahlbacteria bacterium]|nr:site-specific DNA-methyltransferase [Candidatus Stahlbacteria bacterium]
MTNRGIELHYKIKEDLKRRFNPLPNATLMGIKNYGQSRLDGWNNMLILGDNLIVLKTLLEDSEIARQVKLVYIDPPFATNQDFRCGDSRTISRSRQDKIAYQDRIVGIEYLEFLRQRLYLLRDILADDGSIYVHIDWKVGHYVKVLMDEIFGAKRFINNITRVKCNPKSFKRKAYGNMTDPFYPSYPTGG